MRRPRKAKEPPEEEAEGGGGDGFQQIQMPDLPSHILMDILSWLSVKSIIRCRCVCKNWLKLVSDSVFARLHLSRAPTCPLLRDSDTHRLSRSLYLVELERDSSHSRAVNMKLSTIFVLPQYESRLSSITNNVTFCRLWLVNSCNGLLLLCGFSHLDYPHPAVFINNPVTAEYSILPTTRPEDDNSGFSDVDHVTVLGLGFCPKTSQYKVLVIMSSFTSNLMASVYTLGFGPWRRIENAMWFYPNDTTCPATLNGALHWFVEFRRNDTEKFIISFNLETEQFHTLPAPPPWKDVDTKLLYNQCWSSPRPFQVAEMTMGILKERLYICDASSKNYVFQIWLMMEYGVKESWLLEYNIDVSTVEPDRLPLRVRFRNDGYIFSIKKNNGDLFSIKKNNGDLLLYKKNRNALISYGRNKFRYFKISRTRSRFEAIAHVPSFVSLKEVVGDDTAVLNVNTSLANLHGTKQVERLCLEENQETGSDSDSDSSSSKESCILWSLDALFN